MKVVRTMEWAIHSGACWAQGGGIIGQLTKLEHEGVTFYVRENLAGVDHFYMSASARLGMKQGRSPTGSRDVLDLAVPKGVDWSRFAALVSAEDAAGRGARGPREVRKHARFTVAWAEDEFSRRKP